MKRIVFDPKILGGKPVIQGTRITVEFVLELLAGGMTPDEVIREYAHLTKADIRAALAYAAAVVKREEILSPMSKSSGCPA